MKKALNIFKFAEIIQNKSNARQFLYDAFDKKKTILCPHCRCKDYYTMTKSYLRCTKCRNDYNPLYGTWIYEIRIDAAKYETLYKDPTMCASHTRLQWIYFDAKARKKAKPEECDLLVQDVLTIA